MFFLDMCINFHVGFIVTNNFRRRLVTDAHEVARYYAKYGTLPYDILSTVAWIFQLLRIQEQTRNPFACRSLPSAWLLRAISEIRPS